MSQHTWSLSYSETQQLLQRIHQEPGLCTTLVPDTHKLRVQDETGTCVLALRLPLPFPRIQVYESGIDDMGHYSPVPWTQGLESYLKTIPDEPAPYAIILMQAGQASLGTFWDGHIEHHKVIRKYMVRKKQGKSQIKHLKTKGKSRAGSRIRLKETTHFFEEIHETLEGWHALEEAEQLFYHCGPTMWGMLFQAKSATLQPDDARLRHVPHHVNLPSHEELLRINRIILQGHCEAHATWLSQQTWLPSRDIASDVT